MQASLRPLTASDIPAAQALTASFGWPHRREDWALMHSLGKGVAAESDGRLVGTAMCWNYGTDWATMGLIAVSEALQGRGMGRRMMLALIEGLESRKVALHATRAGLRLYGELGFEPTGTVLQHQGAVSQPGLLPLPAGMRLRPVTRSDLPSIVALDRDAVGMNRAPLLSALLQSAGGIGLDRGSALAGFALVRRFGHGQVIGPVVGPDLEGARTMIAHMLGQRTGQFVRIDVPKSGGLSPWLLELGLEEAGTVIRMVRGPDVPPSRDAHTFGLASQAFG